MNYSEIMEMSAKVYAATGTLEKAMQVTLGKHYKYIVEVFDLSYYGDEPYDDVDPKDFENAVYKADKFAKLYDFLKDFNHFYYREPDRLPVDKFMEVANEYLSRATPKWAQ